MDRAELAGPVLAIDHDRLFKTLLTTFFVEFLELFFPKLVASMDRDSIEFLSEEHFVSLLDGNKYLADVIAKARFKGADAYFLIHIEHQNTAPATFGRRFFRYYSVIFEKNDLPVYPIVIYSHDAPKKKQPSVYKVSFADGEVLRFRYRVVQLNRLPWRRFLKSDNPVAGALMAKMKIADRDRPRVKLECLRLLVTNRLDPSRTHLIARFVDAYLNLNSSEEQRLQKSLAAADLLPEQREEVVELLTSWERKGMEKGLAQGLEKGREEGREEGLERGIEKGLERGRHEGALEELRLMLLDELTYRFGPPDELTVAKVRAIDSLEQLRKVTRRVFTAPTLQELGL